MAYMLNMRVKLLEKIQLMLNVTENEIHYLCRPADELVSVLNSKSELDELKFIAECNRLMQSGVDFRTAWNESISKKCNIRFLKKEDVSVIRSFGEMFGTTDCDGQISNCQVHVQLVADKLGDARADRDRYASLSCSMGLISGIGMIILFI